MLPQHWVMEQGCRPDLFFHPGAWHSWTLPTHDTPSASGCYESCAICTPCEFSLGSPENLSGPHRPVPGPSLCIPPWWARGFSRWRDLKACSLGELSSAVFCQLSQMCPERVPPTCSAFTGASGGSSEAGFSCGLGAAVLGLQGAAHNAASDPGLGSAPSEQRHWARSLGRVSALDVGISGWS